MSKKQAAQAIKPDHEPDLTFPIEDLAYVRDFLADSPVERQQAIAKQIDKCIKDYGAPILIAFVKS